MAPLSIDQYIDVDLYVIIGVLPKCTPLDLKGAYYIAALKKHPDKNPSPDATEIFQTLKNAYDILSNHRLRLEYDNMNQKYLDKIYNIIPENQEPAARHHRATREKKRTKSERKKDRRNPLANKDRETMNEDDWEYLWNTYGSPSPEQATPEAGIPFLVLENADEFEEFWKNPDRLADTADQQSLTQWSNRRSRVRRRLEKVGLAKEHKKLAKKENYKLYKARVAIRNQNDQETFLKGQERIAALKALDGAMLPQAPEQTVVQETGTMDAAGNEDTARNRLWVKKMTHKQLATKPLKPKHKLGSAGSDFDNDYSDDGSDEDFDYGLIESSVGNVTYDIAKQNKGRKMERLVSTTRQSSEREQRFTGAGLEYLFKCTVGFYNELKKKFRFAFFHFNTFSPYFLLPNSGCSELDICVADSSDLEASLTWIKKNLGNYDAATSTFGQEMKITETAEKQAYAPEEDYMDSLETFIAEHEHMATFCAIYAFQVEASKRFNRKEWHTVSSDGYNRSAANMAAVKQSVIDISDGHGGQYFKNDQARDEAIRVYHVLYPNENVSALKENMHENFPKSSAERMEENKNPKETSKEEHSRLRVCRPGAHTMVPPGHGRNHGNINIRPTGVSVYTKEKRMWNEEKCARISSILGIPVPQRPALNHTHHPGNISSALATFENHPYAACKSSYPRQFGGKGCVGKAATKADKKEVRKEAFVLMEDRRAEKIWLRRNERRNDLRRNKKNYRLRHNRDSILEYPRYAGQPEKRKKDILIKGHGSVKSRRDRGGRHRRPAYWDIDGGNETDALQTDTLQTDTLQTDTLQTDAVQTDRPLLLTENTPLGHRPWDTVHGLSDPIDQECVRQNVNVGANRQF